MGLTFLYVWLTRTTSGLGDWLPAVIRKAYKNEANETRIIAKCDAELPQSDLALENVKQRARGKTYCCPTTDDDLRVGPLAFNPDGWMKMPPYALMHPQADPKAHSESQAISMINYHP